MRKMTFPTIISVITLIFGAVAITKLICDMRTEEEIFKWELKVLKLDSENAELRRAHKTDKVMINALKESKQELLTCYDEIQRKTLEIEVLSRVILSLREEFCNLKERIPPGNTDWYCLEPYTKITDTASIQYKLQQECETGLATGIRIYTNEEGEIYYTVALGSAYGQDIGDAWRVTIDNGEEFNIMLGEFKDDGETEFFGHPCENEHGEPCTNVIEFIVDWDKVPEEIREYGSMSKRKWCDGNIIKMDYLGRKWGGEK